MKVLIVLALVAAASCAPAKDGEREKRHLYPLQYNSGISAVGVASPLIANQVQQDTVESQHVQTSALKSTSTKTAIVQPAYQTYQAYQPAVQTYQAYQPAVQTYQPAVQTYQPSYVSYQQPAYYSAPAAQVVPVQSSYAVSPVQYVSQPAYNSAYYQPAYSGVVSSQVVSDPWC